MNMSVYEDMIRAYLDSRLSVDAFQREFFARFKGETDLSNAAFDVLDELFGNLDAYTADEMLLRSRPDYYLDEAALRDRVEVTLVKLTGLRQR